MFILVSLLLSDLCIIAIFNTFSEFYTVKLVTTTVTVGGLYNAILYGIAQILPLFYNNLPFK